MMNRPLSRLVTAGVLAGVLALAGLAAASEFSEKIDFDGRSLLVANMIGEVQVRETSGDRFQVEVFVRGKDAERGLIKFEVNDDDGDVLVIHFPIDTETTYVYPALGRGSRTTLTYKDSGDEGGSWLRKVFSGMSGKRIKVRGSGSGLEIWADVVIDVPAGRSLKVRHGVGEITAAGVRADLDLDTHSGAVTASDIVGDLRIDTGSGRVKAMRIEGDVAIDTGSGSVSVGDCRGQDLLVDTGSGGVDVENVVCDKLVVDTGSGSVEARGISAERAKIDTGSGSVVLTLDHMGDGRFVVDTGSGSIELDVPDDASARIVADTGSGKVRNTVEAARVERMERDTMRLVLGDGDAHVSLDAGSGSITVSRK